MPVLPGTDSGTEFQRPASLRHGRATIGSTPGSDTGGRRHPLRLTPRSNPYSRSLSQQRNSNLNHSKGQTESVPAQSAVQQMPELPQAGEIWNIEPNPLPRPPPERNPAVRFLITLLFLIASGALVYFILTILKM